MRVLSFALRALFKLGKLGSKKGSLESGPKVTSIETQPDGSAPAEIMYLPAFGHVNALTARLLQSDLEEIQDREVKPFSDFDHTGKAAAADPKRFIWQPGQGMFLRLAWTRSGRGAVEGKD
jgi:hypothetical protein